MKIDSELLVASACFDSEVRAAITAQELRDDIKEIPEGPAWGVIPNGKYKIAWFDECHPRDNNRTDQCIKNRAKRARKRASQ